ARVAQTADALVLKDGDHFLLCGQSGDVPLRPGHGLGLYWRDCRFLSGYELALEGEAPIALSSTAARGYETLHDLASPEIADARGVGPPSPSRRVRARCIAIAHASVSRSRPARRPTSPSR